MGFSIEAKLARKPGKDDKKALDGVVKSIREAVTKLSNDTKIIREISDADWNKVKKKIYEVAEKYGFFSVEFDMYAQENKFRFYVSDALALEMKTSAINEKLAELILDKLEFVMKYICDCFKRLK